MMKYDPNVVQQFMTDSIDVFTTFNSHGVKPYDGFAFVMGLGAVILFGFYLLTKVF